jgi:predicted DCC family thiol-disulfide oxidoreductase YuxK
MQQSSIILFDGVCNLCNKSVQTVIKNDSKNIFVFAALQSNAGQELLKKFNLPISSFNSFVLIQNNKVFLKSSAALQVARQLDGFFPLLYGFIIVPKFIRDAVYNFIATNRYKWFGQTETCMIPTPALKAKFLN